MKFRTEVEILPISQKIEIFDAIFSIGSCFATEITERLADGQLQTLNNPFGTLFNPWAIKNSIESILKNKVYTEEDLVEYQGEYLSLHHHTLFNTDNAQKTLAKINEKVAEAHQFLKKAKWVIITYGTAFAYEFLPQNNILVANCHKIPQKFFNKRFLTHEELTQSIQQSVEFLTEINPEIQILFTLSPVRHTKDGIVENNLSKAKLLNAMHEVEGQFENCHYLPIYEIVMDDLRDYRFYKEDMIHPNHQAIQYIWEKFVDAYFSAETQNFVNENLSIKKALEHRPKDENSIKHQEFLAQIKERIREQQEKVNHKIFENQ